MKNLQRIVDLANQEEIKYNKQNVEVTFNTANKFVTAKMVLVDGHGVRADLSSLRYKEDEYDYEEAIKLLESMAIDKLCIDGLSNMLNSSQLITGE